MKSFRGRERLTKKQRVNIIRTSTTTTAQSMDKKAITELLRALASDDSKRSKAARLRDVIDDVEAALAAGVSMYLVNEALAAHGLKLTLTTFKTMLQRIRKKRGKPSITASSKPVQQHLGQPAATHETPIPVDEEIRADVSHKQTDLDAIFNNKVDLNELIKQAKKRKEK